MASQGGTAVWLRITALMKYCTGYAALPVPISENHRTIKETCWVLPTQYKIDCFPTYFPSIFFFEETVSVWEKL